MTSHVGGTFSQHVLSVAVVRRWFMDDMDVYGAEQQNNEPADAERLERRKHREMCEVLGEEDASVRLLEDLVFGAEDRLTARLHQEDTNDALDDTCSVTSEDEEAHHTQAGKRKAVWEDEDDNVEEEVDMTHRFRKDFRKGEGEAKMTKQGLQRRLKEQFQKAMGGTPSWAELNKKTTRKEQESSDDEDELLRRTGNYIGSSNFLSKGIIKIKKCLNANHERKVDDELNSVQFHPSAQIVMTAGLDHTISLFQVDGKSNPSIQNIHLEKFPVHKALFTADGEQVVATGMRNKLFYLYDMIEGKVIPVPRVRGLNEDKVKEFVISPDGKYILLTGSSGYFHLMTTKTREVIRSVKINGSSCGSAFTSDSSKIFTSSEDGDVLIWDVRTSKCLKRFEDDGCVKATSLALSKDDLYLACGSRSGVVNIYWQKDCLNHGTPKPLKAVMNLVTPATCLSFNSTSEILAIGSNADNEANRLVHLPSFTVFSNFPQLRKKTIYHANCLDFSPRSGFYSVANNKGQALLFRLLHYSDF